MRDDLVMVFGLVFCLVALFMMGEVVAISLVGFVFCFSYIIRSLKKIKRFNKRIEYDTRLSMLQEMIDARILANKKGSKKNAKK